jgi:hypothetical protein
VGDEVEQVLVEEREHLRENLQMREEFNQVRIWEWEHAIQSLIHPK